MNSTVETQKTRPVKPLGHRAYGSIPHLPGSRRGPADKGLDPRQARILTHHARDRHDHIVVQEKLDGSNVAVAKIEGQIIPLIRAGYTALDSKWEQHRHFAKWVLENYARFNQLLLDGERCVGEWLMEAHGTRYNLPHEPFVIFDIMRGVERSLAETVSSRAATWGFITPRLIHEGAPITIEAVLQVLEPSGHGALDPVEGAVWRCERDGAVDFLGKYVRPDKVDGCYLESHNAGVTIWNWRPSVPDGNAAGAAQVTPKDVSGEQGGNS